MLNKILFYTYWQGIIKSVDNVHVLQSEIVEQSTVAVKTDLLWKKKIKI